MERVLDSNELQHTFVLMTSDTANVATKPAEDNRRSLIPDGKMGTLGRDLSLENRSQILDVLFFESDRRKPYLFRFVSLMVF
jgi:hypothetical protein